MSRALAALHGFYGALRVARFDRTGTAWFANDGDTALTSFWANLFTLPAFLALILLTGSGRVAQVGLANVIAVESLAFAIKLVGSLLVAWHVMELFGKTARFPAFVVATNWFATIQLALYLVVGTLAAVGLVSETLAAFLSLLTVMWALAVSVLIATRILEVSMLTGLGLVAMDLLLTGFVNNLVDATVYAVG